jgi:hypothetical protein
MTVAEMMAYKINQVAVTTCRFTAKINQVENMASL